MKQKIEGGWEQEIKLLWIKGDKLERELGRKAMWEAVLNEAIAISEKEIAKAKASERQRCVEETSDLFADFGDHGVIWVCPDCAKKYHGMEYTEGVTNIYTRVHQPCQGCGETKDIMHYRSYDKPNMI